MVKRPPQLILLPGLDGTGDLFRDLLDLLPRGHDRSVVRYPVNLSSYADLDPIVRSALPEDFPPYVLLAESFSVPLAIRIASTHPGYFRGLILCNGFAASPVRGITRQVFTLAARRMLRGEMGESWIRYFLLGSGASPDQLDQFRRAVSQVPPQVLADRLKEVLHADVRTELKKVQVPILCLHGSQDRLVPASCALAIHALSQRDQSKLVTMEGPHLLLQANPGPSLDAIVDFIFHNC